MLLGEEKTQARLLQPDVAPANAPKKSPDSQTVRDR
jgi:hypothetical protein